MRLVMQCYQQKWKNRDRRFYEGKLKHLFIRRLPDVQAQLGFAMNDVHDGIGSNELVQTREDTLNRVYRRIFLCQMELLNDTYDKTLV